MNKKKQKARIVFLIWLTSGYTYAENNIECLLDITVIQSQNDVKPVTAYTSIKNDGYPMLLIGIDIKHAYAINQSALIQTHRRYCSMLIGQKKDAYLSGQHETKNILIDRDDQLQLRHIHSSGQNYPFWADFYFVEKTE